MKMGPSSTSFAVENRWGDELFTHSLDVRSYSPGLAAAVGDWVAARRASMASRWAI